MSILLNKCIKSGSRILKQQYNFCFQRTTDGKYELSSLVGKLASQNNFRDIINIYEQYKQQFSTEHLALICKSMGRTFFDEKEKSSLKNDKNIKDLSKAISQNIKNMNSIELIDVLFLMRKIKIHNKSIFHIDTKMVVDRVNEFIEKDVYTIRNLVAINFSISSLGYFTNTIILAILKKIQSNTFDRITDINIFTISELLNGIAQRNFLLNTSQTQLVEKILSQLKKNIQINPLSVNGAVNLFKGISKVYLNNINDSQIVDHIISVIKQDMDQMTGIDLINIFNAGTSANHSHILKFLPELKDGIIKILGKDKHAFEPSFILRSLGQISQWNQSFLFTSQQQEIIIDFFESNLNYLKHHNFNKYKPKFIKLFSASGALTISNIILNVTHQANGSLLSLLSEYINVTTSVAFKQFISKEHDSLIDLVTIDLILSKTNSIQKSLTQLKNSNQQKIASKLASSQLQFKVTKLLLQKESSTYKLKIKNLILNKVLQMPREKFFQNLMRTDFLFILAFFYENNKEQLLKKFQSSSQLKKIQKMNLKYLIEEIGDTKVNITNGFWGLIQNLDVNTKILFSCLNHRFLLKSTHFLNNTTSYLYKFLKKLLKNGEVTPELFRIICVLFDLSHSHHFNKDISNFALFNISKVGIKKIGRNIFFKLVKVAKQEKSLSKNLAVELLKSINLGKFNHFQLSLYCIAQNYDQIQRIISAIQQINHSNIDFLLMVDIKYWRNISSKVKQFVQNIKININTPKWRIILSSLRFEFTKDPQYKQITDIIITKFLSEYKNNISIEALSLFELISNFKCNAIDEQFRNNIIKKIDTVNGQRLKICLNILYGNYNQKVFEAFLGNRINFPIERLSDIYYYNIPIPIGKQNTIIELFQKNLSVSNKLMILKILLINDQNPKIKNFLFSLSKDLQKVILEQQKIFSSYYKLKYLKNIPQQSQKIDIKQLKLVQDIKQIAEAANLQFQKNPVINKQMFYFRINNNYIMVFSPNYFMYLPFESNKNNIQKQNSILTIKRKMLQLLTSKKIIMVPLSHSLCRHILFRQIPQLKNATKQKQTSEDQYQKDQSEEQLVLQSQIDD